VAGDFVLDLVGGVSHVDGRVRVGGGHLGLGTLKSRQELAVDKGRFRVLELGSDVAGEAELWRLWDVSDRDATAWSEGVFNSRKGPVIRCGNDAVSSFMGLRRRSYSLDQWRKESNKGKSYRIQRSAGKSSRTTEPLGRQRSGVCRHCRCRERRTHELHRNRHDVGMRRWLTCP
jgi:hypothetical protein